MRSSLDQLEKAIAQAAKRAAARSTVLAVRYARGISSGPFSQAEHDADDSPYARRHGKILPVRHPLWINKQTGRFRKGWKAVHVNVITNPTPYASDLAFGTKRMLPRPYIDAIRERWVALRESETMRELALIGMPVRQTGRRSR